MRRVLALMLVTICVAATAASSLADVPRPQAGPLDGLRFAGQTGEQGKGDHHDDTITFENGVFRSLDCEKWGFGPAPYRAERKGDAYHFRSTLLSSNRGKLEWVGRIVGDAAHATFRWTHERWYWTIVRDYWFKGTRQAGRR